MQDCRPLLGFQLCDRAGANIQGDLDEKHPDVVRSYPSYAIFAPVLAGRLADAAGSAYLLQPIFEGEIDNPLIVTVV